MRSSSWSFVLAALLAACADSAAPTEIAVIIDGDPEVMKQLTRVEAKVYRTDARAFEHPTGHSFALPAGGGPNAAPPKEPLSFGIQGGDAEHIELVIEGYATNDVGVIPVIERKVLARFERGARRALRAHLAYPCFNLSHPCSALGSTCRASAGACMPVEEQATADYPPPPSTEPAVTASRPSACGAAADCGLPDYPCVATTGMGHTCLGRYADWRMPDSSPESNAQPRYDDTTRPGLILDGVTGLTWQHELPSMYPGCTGSMPATPERGSACTWDEAKAYCSALSMGGLRFRLPSKIELESLIDLRSSEPPFDTRHFVGRPLFTMYWTASPVASTVRTESVAAWIVSWPGATGVLDVTRPAAVRCVSGTPTTASTPGQRYVMESESVVRDARTSLTWTRGFSGALNSLDDARSYCAALGGGFRVPSHKELLTLVDPTRDDPALHPIFIDNGILESPSVPFWSSSVTAGGTLFVNFLDGMAYARDAALPATGRDRVRRVRCVR